MKMVVATGGMASLVCALALGGAPLHAAEPDPVVPEPAESEANDEGSAAARAATNRYELEVQRLEGERGAWDPQLGEQLLGLGLIYQDQDQHDEAVETLKRAMYIKRVNDGIYDMGQVPILREIIESDVATRNWEDLDQAYEQLLFIHRRNFEPGDPRFLPILDTVGAWKIRAYTQGLLDEPPTVTINSAERLYRDSVKLLEKQYGETDPRLIDPLYGRAVVSYQLFRETAAKSLEEFDRGISVGAPMHSYQRVCAVVPGTTRIICQTIPTGQGGYYASKYAQAQDEKDREMQRYFNIVGESLKQVVAIHDAHPELDAESRARALVNLADWNMLKRRRDTAADLYKRAYGMLAAEAEAETLLDKYFGAPKAIPTLRMSVPEVDRKLDEIGAQSYVVLTMDVTKRGETRNLQVVEQSNPEDQGAVRRAREKIKGGSFRPRFENGEPVDTSAFEIRITGTE